MPGLLRSLRVWVDEIIVADMASTDRTCEIARSFGARLLHVEDSGYADPARAESLAAVATEWVLSIDADEIVPASLARILLDVVQSDAVDAVKVPFRTFFLGAELRGTGWQNDEHVRLFRRNCASFDDTVHDFLRLTKNARVKTLSRCESNSILHFNYSDSSQFVEKLNRYTTAESKKRSNPSLVEEFYRPVREFIKRFIILKGYRDGWRGAYLSILMSGYVLLQNLKLRELRLTGGGAVVLGEYSSRIAKYVRELENDFDRGTGLLERKVQ